MSIKCTCHLVIILLLSNLCKAQIIAPDTVCVGTTVTFSTPKTATTYTWDFSPVTVVQPISPISLFYPGFSSPTWTCFNKDGADYYCFVTNYFSEHVFRMSFGPSVHSTPVVTDLGTLGMSGSQQEGIDIVKDTATGMWYGLVVDNSSMAVLSFGSSLGSTPTSVVTSYPAHMFWTHQVTIKRYNGNWIAFIANRNAGITRFDFGSSLTNPPTITDIPNVGSVANPCNFSLYQQGGNWYMLVTSLISGQISRYDFGTNLLNNTPTGTLLPSPAGMLYLPRYINLLNDCNGNILGYMGNETGNILKLDFGGNITNMPVFTDLGPSGITNVNACSPAAYDDSLAFLFVDYSGGIYKYFPMRYSTPTFINYYNPVQPYSFPSPGLYNITLFYDQGYTSGPSVACKSIYVVTDFGATSRKDTLVCGGPVTLYADTSGSHLWSTGDTTSSITVSASGTYWVTTTNICAYKSDTTNVIYFGTGGNLPNDTSVCSGSSIILAPAAPAGTTYVWSTGSTASSITVSAAGTYWVTMTNGPCSVTDTVNVAVKLPPPVDLGPDTSNCFLMPITLQSLDTYTSPSYLWSTGSSTSSITVTSSGAYWLDVTVDGCTGSDTINVTMATDTLHLFNGDTAICRGKSVPVFLNINPLATVQWLPTAGIPNYTLPQPVITPDTSAMYRVTVSLPGCPDVTDSFYIDVQPNPVLYAGGNRSVCQFDTLHLHASVSPNWYTHYTYSWSPATSLDDPAQPTVIFTPGADTKYYVTVTTPHGCSSIDSAFITIHPNNFAKLDTSYTLCPHDSVQLQPSGGVSYIWHPGMYLSDSTSSSPWVYAVTSISYTAVAISQYGCLDTVTTHVTIQPQAHIYLPDSIELYSGQTYQLDPQTNCTYFTWFPQAGLDNAYISNPIASPLISTKYIVHGRTEWGCEAVDSISFYLKETVFGVPNAFTPGQEVNGKLLLMKLGNGKLNYFRIYNRWGNKVFETSNINEGWDGTYKGVPQPFDVYVYVIEATTDEGKIFKKQGNITLIR